MLSVKDSEASCTSDFFKSGSGVSNLAWRGVDTQKTLHLGGPRKYHSRVGYYKRFEGLRLFGRFRLARDLLFPS